MLYIHVVYIFYIYIYISSSKLLYSCVLEWIYLKTHFIPQIFPSNFCSFFYAGNFTRLFHNILQHNP